MTRRKLFQMLPLGALPLAIYSVADKRSHVEITLWYLTDEQLLDDLAPDAVDEILDRKFHEHFLIYGDPEATRQPMGVLDAKTGRRIT